jgi:hypothetical protein
MYIYETVQRNFSFSKRQIKTERDKPSVNNMFDFVLSNVLCVVNIPTEMNLARRFVSCLVRLRFNPWPVAHKQLTD